MNDLETIKNALRQFPQKIAELERGVEETRHAWDLAVLGMDAAYNRELLKAKAAGAKESDAKATAKENSGAEELAALQAEHSYRKMVVEKNLAENQFVSVRKMASLIEAEILKLGVQ